MKTARIGTLNLLNTLQSKERLEAVVAAMDKSKLDYLLLQEVVERETLSEAFAEAGYSHIVFSEPYGKGKDSLAVVSKYPLTVWDGSLNPYDAILAKSIFPVQTVFEGKRINLLSAHFYFGASEARRLKQAEIADDIALRLSFEDVNSITILGGDLNAEPDARSIRFLKGFDVSADGKTSTVWTDAHRVAGRDDNFYTSRPSSNVQARATAFTKDIVYPGFLPDRRIDYLFSYGWTYGKIGSPLSFSYLIGDLELSDHDGIFSDFLIEV